MTNTRSPMAEVIPSASKIIDNKHYFFIRSRKTLPVNKNKPESKDLKLISLNCNLILATDSQLHSYLINLEEKPSQQESTVINNLGTELGTTIEILLPRNLVASWAAHNGLQVTYKVKQISPLAPAPIPSDNRFHFIGLSNYAINQSNQLVSIPLLENNHLHTLSIPSANNNPLVETSDMFTYPIKDQMLLTSMKCATPSIGINNYKLYQLDQAQTHLIPMLKVFVPRFYDSFSSKTDYADLSPNGNFLSQVIFKDNSSVGSTHHVTYTNTLYIFNLDTPQADVIAKQVICVPASSVTTKPYHWISSNKLIYIDEKETLQCFDPYTHEQYAFLQDIRCFNFLPNGDLIASQVDVKSSTHTFNSCSINNLNYQIYMQTYQILLEVKKLRSSPIEIVSLISSYISDPRCFSLQQLPQNLEDHIEFLKRRIKWGEANQQVSSELNAYYAAMSQRLKEELQIALFLKTNIEHTSSKKLEECLQITLDKYPNAREFPGLAKFFEEKDFKYPLNFKNSK